METMTQTEDAILQKTRELCESILEQPQFLNIRQRVDAFMGNPAAQKQYETLSDMGQQLHEKQHHGQALTAAEISAFDQQRDAFFANPIAKGFVDAQDEMNQIKQQVTKMVSKTLELGRVPHEDELSEGGGSCGSGCGCHH
jgi:cell fate (sporulation/competence/biofilm development) regulator YlbF (YheA/YmcA/DUF963 family)